MKEFFKVILYQPLFNLFIAILAITPGHSVAVAIIIITFLIRLLLTPIKYKSIESQLKQREIQPEIKRIQEKYKDDRQAQSTAMMQLYKDKGVNPASGCLPMIVQLALLISLYSVFRHGWGPSQESVLYSFVHLPPYINSAFFWVKDLTQADHTLVLPVLAGIAQFFYTRSMMASMPTPVSTGSDDMSAIMSKQMMYLGPAFTILIGRTLPAALTLYWLVGTLVDWYQQVHVAKRVNHNLGNKVSVSVRTKKKETL
ncbi:MAG TPA: YidC/Oxa1 family membrane protein insertase [Patescibacteria group bacterium]